MNLIDQHRAYMKRDRSKAEKVTRGEACPCEACGCTGNNDCGHPCVDEKQGCRLNRMIVCPCCVAEDIAPKSEGVPQ